MASLIFLRSWTSLQEFGLFFTAKIRVLCGEWVGIKMETLKMVYDRLKSLVGLQGERVMLSDYS